MDSNFKIKEDLINKLSIGVVIADQDGQLLFTNQTIKEMTGYSEAEIKSMEDWYKKAYPDPKQREKAKKDFQYDMENNITDRTYKIKTAAGDYKFFNFRYSRLAGNKMLFEIIDISHRIKQKQELEEIKERLELAVDGSNIGIWDWNVAEEFIHYNKNWAQMLGYKISELGNELKTWTSLLHPQDRDEAIQDVRDHLAGKTERYFNEHRLKTKSGNWKWIRDIGKVTERDENGKPLRIVGVHIDIDQEKRAAAEIEYLSNHDELTGLYNRRYFNEELKRLHASRKYPISIIVGDMNKLKDINDNFGHSMGDRYIKRAAEAIKNSVRNEDVVARIGGDEFAIILPETDYSKADQVVERILIRLEEDNKIEELPVPLTIALGYETTDSTSQNPGLKNIRNCYNKADKKMYKQKFAGRC